MERQIVLDDKSFKALSADSRVSILKSLGERRRTLSELSQKLDLGNSTVKEHCDILINAELIKQIDEGRKWKYYELTQKGKQIVMPNLMEEVKVLIILCFGVIMIGAIAFFAMQMFTGASASYSAAPQMEINTILGQNSQTALTKATADINDRTGGSTNATAGINVNDLNQNTSKDNNIQNGLITTMPKPSEPAQCTTTAQCSISGNYGVTPEFFVLSTMISIIFGIVLGWAIVRRH